jgi:NADH-quinone oxidoreductase subunit C
VTSENPPEEGQNLPDPAAVAGQERLAEPVARGGMFGTVTSGDTSGYGGLRVRRVVPAGSQRP